MSRWRASLVFIGLVFVACGDPPAGDEDSGTPPVDAGTSDAGPPPGMDAGPMGMDAGPGEDAGPGTDAGADAGPAPTELVVNVVGNSFRRGQHYEPLGDAFVRVDGDGVTEEAMTDAAGNATVLVPPDSGPWTITAAAPTHTATSVFGVTGPLEGSIHLATWDGVEPTTRSMGGTVTGRATTGDASVHITGPDIYAIVLTGDAWVASLIDLPGTVRFLALEWVDPMGTPPDNAVWIDLDRDAADLTMTEIAFPDPPRALVASAMTVQLPTTGLLPSAVTVGGANVQLRTDEWGFPVGHVDATESATVPGQWDLAIQAYDGDMAPTHVFTQLEGDAMLFLANAPFADGGSFEVPPVEQLEPVPSDSVASVSVDWDADTYDYVGASLVNDGAPGGWFIYSYDVVTGPFTLTEWPQLPSGVSLADLNFDTATDVPGRLNAFGVTYETGVRPWEWSRLRTQRATVVVADIAGGVGP